MFNRYELSDLLTVVEYFLEQDLDSEEREKYTELKDKIERELDNLDK